MVIRACAADAEENCSNSVSASYFVGDRFARYEGISVVSLVLDPDDLLDEEKGIYALGAEAFAAQEAGEDPKKYQANFIQRGVAWERYAHVSIFSTEHTLEVNQNVGARIAGANSRWGARKSFRLYAYDTDTISAPLFADNLNTSGEVIDSYGTVLIQNGGNLQYSTVFDNSFLQNWLQAESNSIQTGRFRPIIVFLNGELWGCYVLQADITASEYANRLAVSEEDIAIIKKKVLEAGTDEDLQDFTDLVNYVRTSYMSDEESYQYVCSRLDVEALAEYVAIEMYICNTDWPGNNFGFYRNKNATSTDTRWKPILYDLDLSMGYHKYDVDGDVNRYKETIQSKLWVPYLFYGLLENQEFQEVYAQAAAKVAARFDAEAILEAYNQVWNTWQPLYTISREANVNVNSAGSTSNRLKCVTTFLTNRASFEQTYVSQLLEAAANNALEAYATAGNDDEETESTD